MLLIYERYPFKSTDRIRHVTVGAPRNIIHLQMKHCSSAIKAVSVTAINTRKSNFVVNWTRILCFQFAFRRKGVSYQEDDNSFGG